MANPENEKIAKTVELQDALAFITLDRRIASYYLDHIRAFGGRYYRDETHSFVHKDVEGKIDKVIFIFGSGRERIMLGIGPEMVGVCLSGINADEEARGVLVVPPRQIKSEGGLILVTKAEKAEESAVVTIEVKTELSSAKTMVRHPKVSVEPLH